MGTSINNYNDFITRLQDSGLKTTRTGKNEADFSNYVNALSGDVKQDIMDSFDCKADYDLQSRLASLYADGNFESMGDLRNACKSMGISMSVEYVGTSYIVDNKKGGQYANNKSNATNGHIAMYTFTDANGGEIKIADANGNGGLETEELFMNEILSGIASDVEIDTSNIPSYARVGFGSNSDTKSWLEDFLAKEEEEKTEETEEKKEPIALEEEETEADVVKEEGEEQKELETVSQLKYESMLQEKINYYTTKGYGTIAARRAAEQQLSETYQVA